MLLSVAVYYYVVWVWWLVYCSEVCVESVCDCSGCGLAEAAG